jgi:Zn-dependent protease with chaperone function
VNALAVTGGVLVLLAVGGLAGPRLLRRLEPGLAARPRWGLALWTTAGAVWTLGLVALGPLVAWSLARPALPGLAGVACQRCLAAANPFGTAPPWGGVVPGFLPLAASGVLIAVMTAVTVHRLHQTRRAVRAHVTALQLVAEPRLVRGVAAWVVPSVVPSAYSLPTRRGVVLSTGVLDALDDTQLDAVLAHEQAHRRGHHHLLIALGTGLRRVLGVVPLIAAAHDSVTRYAEMTADDAARRHVGTPALAGALLALQTAGTTPSATPAPAEFPTSPALAMHAARHLPLSRAQRLVAPPAPPSTAALVTVGTYLSVLAAVVAIVAGSTLSLVLAGSCA